MELIPAIDLLGGAVVRLAQGDYDRVTDYGDDPVAVALGWQRAGATRLHLVDLEAARDGSRGQAPIIERVVAAVGIPCQVAGGIRDAVTARAILAAGADRVVMGTALIRDPGLAAGLVAAAGPDRIVAAVDIRDGRAVGDGWTAGATEAPALGLISQPACRGRRPGSRSRPSIGTACCRAPTSACSRRPPRPPVGRRTSSRRRECQASRTSQALAAAGYQGAILGRALYEGRIDLAEALALAG